MNEITILQWMENEGQNDDTVRGTLWYEDRQNALNAEAYYLSQGYRVMIWTAQKG